MTPEGKIKRKVVEMLKYHDVWYFFPGNNGFGKSGIPDIIAIVGGRFVGIECKAGNNRPTELQLRNLEAIRDNAGIALVVNENDLEALEQRLETLT